MRILILALGVSACTVQPPDDQPDPMMDPMPDAGSTEPTLRLDQTLTNTNYFSVPVSGKGPGSGSLLVETPARGAYSTTIGADGCFCLDVPLSPQMLNTLRFKAMDSTARYTPEVAVDVTQSGTPPGMPTPGVPTPLARNGTVHDTTLTVISGSNASLTDGNASTWVDLENAILSSDWIAIQLAQRGLVDIIRVRSMPACPMKEFKLFISDANDPGAAVSGATDWTFVYHETNGDGDNAYQMFMPTAARFFGIEFLSTDCYGPVSNHYVSEIEVFTPPPPPPDSPDAPSCMNTTRTCG